MATGALTALITAGTSGIGRAFGYEPNARPISSYFFLENIGFSQVSYRLLAQEPASTYYILKAAKKLSPQTHE